MNEPVKLFIVEGNDRDYRLINNMINTVMVGRFKSRIITVSAAQNIYMLYEKLKEDGFETDIVELLKEQSEAVEEQLKDIDRQDVSEIYMFFDFDIQADNLKVEDGDAETVVLEMLSAFDNETENGKLYLSYPMVEAFYDYRDGLCQAFSGCYVSIANLFRYKNMAGDKNPKSGLHHRYEDWRSVLNVYAMRTACLFDKECIDFDYYRSEVNPVSVYKRQMILCNTAGKVFVLSGLPGFLLDYFRKDFWNSNIRLYKQRYDYCEKLKDSGSGD